MNTVMIGLILYLMIILFIGVKAFRRNTSHSDYLLADRTLGSWAIALSERASGESAWLLIGLPGAAMVSGYLEIWSAFGCLLGIFFAWKYLAKPLRELAGKYNSLTLPDLMTEYFKDGSNSLRITASLIITFFFTFYVAAQFNGAGKVLNVTFGIPTFTGMVIGAGIILFYTSLGGFFAVVWTDVVQALIMFATLVILPVVGLFELFHRGQADIYPMLSDNLSWTGGQHGVAGFIMILGGLSWGLGYTGQPHLLARYIAIRSVDDIPKSRMIAYMWAIPAFMGAFFLGIIGMKLYGGDFFSDPEHLMPYMATELLPGWFAGILISGAVAAMMSTADSQLLVTTSALAEDLYHKAGNRPLSSQKLLISSRWITVIVGCIAFLLAWNTGDLVFATVSYAWSGLGASFGPVLVLMIYWKGITRQGALAGMISGATSTILWKSVPCLNSMITERFSSYVIALAVIWIVSYLTRASESSKSM